MWCHIHKCILIQLYYRSVENNATPARTESSSEPNQQKEKKDTKENKET